MQQLVRDLQSKPSKSQLEMNENRPIIYNRHTDNRYWVEFILYIQHNVKRKILNTTHSTKS